MPNSSFFHPLLKDILPLNFVPSQLEGLKDKIEEITTKLFYKNFHHYVSSSGDAANYNITIVSQLVDTEDFSNSWKLKRNFDLLKPTILTYLDNFKTKKIEDLKVAFNFKGKPQTFTALTDIIFVVK